MAQDRTALRAPPAIQRRPAVSTGVQRSAAESPRSPARALQERFGNRASQILISRAIASQTRETSEGHDTVLPPIQRAEQSPKSARLPAKVSKANDPAELEADETARKVMRMNQAPAPKPTATPTPTQKGIATGTVQRAEASSPATAPSSASRMSIPGGSPLPSSVRSHMEPRFGANFGNVRVHTGDSAAQQSASLNARAFTVGDHIFFGKEKYQPQSPSGRELIAHELTHTIQQGAAVQRSVDTPATPSDQPQVQRKAAVPNSPGNNAATQQTVSSQVVDISTSVFNPSEKVKGEIEAQRQKGLMVRVVVRGVTGEGQVKIGADGKEKYSSLARGSLPLLNPWAQQFGLYLNFTVNNNAIVGYASPKQGGGNPSDWLQSLQANPGLLGGVGLKVEKPSKLVNKFENGKLTLGLTDLGVTLGGFLDAKFNVLVENANQPTIHGTAKIKITGIEDGGILTLDNTAGKLTGEVSLGIKHKSFSGSAVVKYLADGTVDISGKAAYSADKLSGEIQFVATDLEAANKFAKDAIKAAGGVNNVQDAPPPAPVPAPKPGKKPRALAATGILKFNLTQWFAGTVNVVVDGKGDVTVIGKIAPPGEIQLFPQKSWDKELFKFEAKAYYGIPVVGNLNLFANISLHALADLGPAKIYKIEVLGTYSTDPEIQKKIEISGSINISAYAGLRLRAEGGAGIEILSHDLKFGIGLNADVGVKAYAEARPTIGYRDPGVFYISGTLEMIAQPMLGLGGEFFIELETPWWSPLSDDKWTWPLFSKEWPLTDPIGINASLKEYVLGSGNIPEIELKKPEFDPSKFMTSMVDRKLPDKSGGPGTGSGAFKDDGSVAKPTVTPKKQVTKTEVKTGKKGAALTGGKSGQKDPKAESEKVATTALKSGLDGLKTKEPYSQAELKKVIGALKTKVKGISFDSKAQGDKWIVTASGSGKKKSAGKIELAMKKEGATSDESEKALAALDQVTQAYASKGATLEEMTAAVKSVRRKFKFKSLTVDQQGGLWYFEYEINPKGRKPSAKVAGATAGATAGTSPAVWPVSKGANIWVPESKRELAEVIQLDSAGITYRVKGASLDVRRNRESFMRLWNNQSIRIGATVETSAQRRDRLIKAHGHLVGTAIADAVDRRGDLAANAGIYSPQQAHHVIPVSLLEKVPRLQLLVAAGWNFNQAINGVPIAANLHGSHQEYTSYVDKEVAAWEAAHGNSPIADFQTWVVGTLIPKLKTLIEKAKASNTSLNDFFAPLV
ncbi:MAG TPA: hypothetical protein DC054_10740 [Blastocatellia bacterium]|nr:hypothetical protein [Blastocatellia bacterium]